MPINDVYHHNGMLPPTFLHPPTRAEEAAYKRMRMVLQTAHRTLHNRMHRQGVYHDHTPATDHAEHDRRA